jgi:hypothetical protein
MSFQGSLNELPLADIVQLVAVSGKTGMFSLSRSSERGFVYLHNGQITHAKLGDIEGEDAVYALAVWSQGSFQFSPGIESDARTINRSNTNLLIEAARRSDEWKILSRKIPGTDAVPTLLPRERSGESVTLTPPEWLVVTKVDGRRTIDEISRVLRQSSFDVAKTLYGLVTAELVEIGRREAPKPAPTPPPLDLRDAVAPGTGQAITTVSTHSGVFQAVARGDEKRSLQILCTKVKQEAESAAWAPGEPTIDRLYHHALTELDHGRGLDVVRDLIRTLEQSVTKLRGAEAARSFREKMSPLL